MRQSFIVHQEAENFIMTVSSMIEQWSPLPFCTQREKNLLSLNLFPYFDTVQLVLRSVIYMKLHITHVLKIASF